VRYIILKRLIKNESAIIEGLEADAVLADKGYDAQEIVQDIELSGGMAVVVLCLYHYPSYRKL
jgi:hypothetical protein